MSTATKRIPKQLPHEEVVETWNDDKHGEYVQINDDGSVVEVAHGCAMKAILTADVANSMPDFQKWAAIRAWMEESQYWPNIWSVNDHGNVTLHDKDGNVLGGIV